MLAPSDTPATAVGSLSATLVGCLTMGPTCDEEGGLCAAPPPHHRSAAAATAWISFLWSLSFSPRASLLRPWPPLPFPHRRPPPLPAGPHCRHRWIRHAA
uniref:Uncharacterized protein n=1 Tax=Arundo donax TaxID=35708 RepID=A0A0A8Y600_ARUDO